MLSKEVQVWEGSGFPGSDSDQKEKKKIPVLEAESIPLQYTSVFWYSQSFLCSSSFAAY